MPQLSHDNAHLSKPGMLYRRKRDFEAASAFALFKRSVAVRRRCVNSRISSSGLLRIFQKRHCSKITRRLKPKAISARAVTQKVQLVQSKNMQISCSTFFV